MQLEFHHIIFVSTDVNRMHEFYTSVLGLKDIPLENFPRPSETKEKVYSVEIKLETEVVMTV